MSKAKAMASGRVHDRYMAMLDRLWGLFKAGKLTHAQYRARIDRLEARMRAEKTRAWNAARDARRRNPSFRGAAARWFSHGRGEYIGDPMPSWVRPGAKVKVKSTPMLKKYGLRAGRGPHDRAWPGMIGEIYIRQGANESKGAFWTWGLRFRTSYTTMDLPSLGRRELEDLVRVK